MKQVTSIRINDKDVKKSIDATREKINKKAAIRIPGYVSGGGYSTHDSRLNTAFFGDKIGTDTDSNIKRFTSYDSMAGTNDPSDRKSYFNDILNISNTEEFNNYFENRFSRDGVLMNLGKLISDEFTDAMNFSKRTDPRIPTTRNKIGARARARLRFEGWANEDQLWGFKNDKGEWVYNEHFWNAKADANFNEELLELADRGSIGQREVSSGLVAKHRNYHFNLGLGFGESPVLNPYYQYNELDDPRTHLRFTKIGRVYVQKVLNNQSMVHIMPGKIKYHTNALKMLGIDFGAAKANANYIRQDNWFRHFISAAWMGITDVVGTSIAFATSIFGGGKLITFRQQYNLFEKYFNNTITQMAYNMGLMSPSGIYVGRWKILSLTHILPGIGLQRSGAGGVGKGFRSNQMIAFNVSNSISCSETISNSTRENPLMAELNQESSEANADTNNGGFKMIGDFFKNILNTINTGDISHLSGVASKLGIKIGANMSEMMLIKSGGARMTLPEVWDSSSFSRSYSFSWTLHSPYGSNLAKFETWGPMVAFFLTLGLPRQVGKYSYTEPFIARIVMPGKFNINYAILESLTIDRGENINDWGQTDNLPKTVKISATFKDFQPNIMLPQASRSLIKQAYESLFPASGFAEYMSTICGLSLADQFDWKKRMGRTWKNWTAGWRRRTNVDMLQAEIFGFNAVNNILNIFWPFYDVYDKIEKLEDDARKKEYISEGIKLTKNAQLKAKLGRDTGVDFLFPIRDLYRYVYGSDDDSTIGKLTKLTAKVTSTFKGFTNDDETNPDLKINQGKNLDSSNLTNEE